MATRAELCGLRERALREAIERIEDVRESLDTRVMTCDCCGQIGRENWEEYISADVLDGVLRRLNRTLESDITDPDAAPISGMTKPKLRKGGSNGNGDTYEPWKPESG